MAEHQLISRRSKSGRKSRRSTHPDTESTTAPIASGVHIQHSSPQDILQLQEMIGNHATRQHLSSGRVTLQREIAPLTIHATTPHIQRTPLSEKEAELASAELAREATKGGSNARKRANQRITKIKEEIEALKSAPAPEPPKPKTAAEEFPSLKPTFTDDEITQLRSTLTADKLREVVAVFQPADLKSHVETFTLDKFKGLLDVLTTQEANTYITELTAAKLNDVLVKYSVTALKAAVEILTLAKFKELLVTFSVNQVWTLGTRFTYEKVKQLITVWPATTINAMVVSLGLDILSDLMAHFTGAELKTFVTAVTIPRFEWLTKTQKLKAPALKKYGAAWLKTFVGANATTMNHLTTIATKSDGVISGGHDASVFYPELDRIIGTAIFQDDNGDDYEDDITNGRVTSKQVKTNYDKVIYATHNDDGSTKNTGAKSLIHNLMTQQPAWLKRANEAIWAAIRAETFDKAGGAWSGTSVDGVALNGFYQSGKVQVDTFFPVN